MKLISDKQRLKIIEQYAFQAHKHQVDKAGEPYIGHIKRVSEGCESISAKIVALLHDITEDKQATFEDLESLGILRKDEILAIKLLDKTFPWKYQDPNSKECYYKRIKKNKLAREVKISDLLDNLCLSRFIRNGIELTEKHFERVKNYEKRLNFLLDN